MENSTPFDLNRAIQHWRENLSQSPALRSENLNELESHLRDSIATLQTRGLSNGEAFMVAAKRIGKEDLLEAEFGKVNGQALWLDRALWMLIGIQFWGFVSGVFGSATRSAVSFGLISYDFTAHGRVIPAILYEVAHLLGFTGSLAICWWLIFRRGSSLSVWITNFLRRHRLSYLAFTVSCVLIMLSLAMMAMNYGITILQLEFTDMNKFNELARSQQYSWIAGAAVQSATFVTLTLMLARKRLRVSKARDS